MAPKSIPKRKHNKVNAESDPSTTGNAFISKKINKPKEADELELEQLLFGADSTVETDPTTANKSSTSTSDENIDQDSTSTPEDTAEGNIENFFFLDTAPKSGNLWQDASDKAINVNLASKKITKKLRIAENETEITSKEYEKRLREQFTKINPIPNWASQKPSGDKENELLEFTTSTRSLQTHSNSDLPSDRIDIARVKNANQLSISHSVVQQIEFHPTSNIILVAGNDKTLRLFEVDGTQNSKVQSVYFKDLPIMNAQFFNNANEILITGRRPNFYTFDIQTGSISKHNNVLIGDKLKTFEKFKVSPNEGSTIAIMGRSAQIMLLDSKTKRLANTLHMNYNVKDIAFGSDPNHLYSIGSDAEVYLWDLRSTRCVSKWKANQVYKPTCLSLTKDEKNVVIGDGSGMVSIFENDSSKKFIDPFKIINNLTTPISQVEFNHDNQLMGFYSRNVKDKCKLLNYNTKSVYGNWPTDKTPLGYVQCLKFSPNSGYMAVGNDKGNVLLYQLSHYQHY
ncbi:hypothetical protein BB561_004580 [Smittium simulii]|uniref:Uncharacterized protein n=1 Tax=Smittium simulii TaxID=133385 RepID=A0A2T9YFF8_9FUNG|nr:hypothetical protein BB561_004580 [Smittium simulii]